MTRLDSAPRRRWSPLTGGSLQRSLIALVLVPIVGLAVLTIAVTRPRALLVHSAERAVALVQEAVALDAVRAGVAQEMLPATGAGLPLSSAERTAVTRAVGATQNSTDATIAATVGTGAAEAAAHTAARLRTIRASGAAGAGAGAVFVDYRELTIELSDTVSDNLDEAGTEGIGLAAAQAISDLQRLTESAMLASLEVQQYLAIPLQVGGDGEPAPQDQRIAFLRTWGSLQQESVEVAESGTPAIRAAWAAAMESPSATLLAETLTAAAKDSTTPAPGMATGTELAAAGTLRDVALRAVVLQGTAHAVAAVEAQAAQTDAAMRRVVLWTNVLLLLTIVGTWWVRRSIAGPLRTLAAQARAVGQGELVEVSLAGPAEVRTVAQGLAAAVQSLRQVRAQAQAVADGDLDSEIVHEALTGPLGEVVHASVTQMIAAIRDRDRLRSDLVHQASHDALTELPNRAQALVLIKDSLLRAERAVGQVGVLFVDLDHFKRINDSMGHRAGDELLRVVGARMKSQLRGGDVVCRLGGDEFLVLVQDGQDLQELTQLGRRLIEAVCLPVPYSGRSMRVGASIGVALSRAGDVDPGRLVNEADTAAYRAKAAGRGVVEVFDEDLRAELEERACIDAAVRAGLRDGEMVLFYQPVVHISSGEMRGVEALVRWQRPGHGLVEPGFFIDVVEASDLVCDLGRWALAEATAQLVRWDAEGGDRVGIRVAVNISGRHLSTPQLLVDVADALTASGVAPSRLMLEITETVLVTDPLAIQHLRLLRELGVRLAIDDFGTGYTSIGQLSKLPVDVLKIDRSLVASTDPRTVAIVKLVIGAAHTLSLGVVAEGVEEESQLQALRAASCEYVQGYLFSRPVPAAELPATGARVLQAIEN